jgi:hypothetical protein
MDSERYIDLFTSSTLSLFLRIKYLSMYVHGSYYLSFFDFSNDLVAWPPKKVGHPVGIRPVASGDEHASPPAALRQGSTGKIEVGFAFVCVFLIFFPPMQF